MRVAILTVSDSVVAGARLDTSGQAIVDWCTSRHYAVAEHKSVADDTSLIVPQLVEWCDFGDVDLVLTTGGTGLAPRDVTPEATSSVIEREAQGIAEYLRASSYGKFPRAALSRGLAGVRGLTLVINLPGSPSGVADALETLSAIVDHAVDVTKGMVREHDTPLGKS
ncbi:MAG: MogA/MoaB family molybdenum cofactor biosynthesis protein [Gemmatimonadales bacterium]